MNENENEVLSQSFKQYVRQIPHAAAHHSADESADHLVIDHSADGFSDSNPSSH